MDKKILFIILCCINVIAMYGGAYGLTIKQPYQDIALGVCGGIIGVSGIIIACLNCINFIDY
jgi:hypothetical protein